MILRLLAAGVLTAIAWCQVLEQAKRAFDAGDYSAAAQLFEKAHKAAPRCEILFYLGMARHRLMQRDAALIAFQSSVQCNPKLVLAHLALAEAYSERGNESEALSAYNRVLALEPVNPAALRGAAAIYLRNQVNDKATALLEVLTKVDGRDQQAHTDLAAAYAATGNRDGAESQYQQALRLKPDSASALMGLGNVYLKKGEEEQAIALLQKAAQLAPNAYEPRFLLGSAYNRGSRFAEALAALESALRLGGAESAEVYYHLARTYGGLGRPDDRTKALGRFAELTRKSKEDVEAQRRAMRLVEKAASLVETGDLRTALARMEEARELRPADAQLLFRLASLHYDLARYDLARNYAQEAISLTPSAWVYHYLLGRIEKSAGRWQPARTSLETAIRLNPSAPELHNALGEVMLGEGNAQGAMVSFGRAVELDPQKAEYRVNLEAARRVAVRR